MGQNDETQELIDLWDRCSEGQRWFIFILCWLEMQKKTKLFWLFMVTAVSGSLIYAVSRDPIATGIALAVGLSVGLLFILR